MNQALRRKIESLPTSTGCYLFRDARGALLYVGKATSLRARVQSYFRPGARHTPRIARMVEEVADLDVILTDTEKEALLLESNLVRQHRPRDNVRLKDDKNFPYLRLSVQNPFPRVTLVRRVRRDGAAYFGPYLPASLARRTLRLVPRFFQVANCRLPFDGTQRPCLYYHLDQCLAPCAGKAEPGAYARQVAEARLFLEGRHRELESSLRRRMQEEAVVQAYERAAATRDLLATMERLGERQNITTPDLENGDYWAAHREDGKALVELFCMREGRVQTRREFRLDRDEAGERFYDQVLIQYYLDHEPPAHVFLAAPPGEEELLAQVLSERRDGKVTLRVPRRGRRKRFLDLVARNARLAFEERFGAAGESETAVIEELGEVLDLPAPPSRIECLDVSHHQGRETYASLVVFQQGRPRRSDYRLFKVRGEKGGDDPAALGEVAHRRYTRLAGGEGNLPDLVLVDGGKGQLGAVRRTLLDLGLDKLPVASIAKREEEIFVEGRGDPILLDRSSPVLQLVQRLRDEAHRFALRHHRAAHRRRTLRTSLLRIPGVGPVLARRLLRRFGSVKGVRRATREELAAVVGPRRAEVIHRALAGPRDPGGASR